MPRPRTKAQLKYHPYGPRSRPFWCHHTLKRLPAWHCTVRTDNQASKVRRLHGSISHRIPHQPLAQRQPRLPLLSLPERSQSLRRRHLHRCPRKHRQHTARPLLNYIRSTQQHRTPCPCSCDPLLCAPVDCNGSTTLIDSAHACCSGTPAATTAAPSPLLRPTWLCQPLGQGCGTSGVARS